MFQSNWPWHSSNRPAYFKPITHQTLIGKALFEHSLKCSTVAAVAGVSPNFRNSSLGPNLLALVDVNEENQDLFFKVFFADPNSTLQFTNSLCDRRDTLAQHLCQTKYFGMNDLTVELYRPSASTIRNLFEKCKRIVSLTVIYFSQPQEGMFDSFDGSRLKRLFLTLQADDSTSFLKILYERSPNLEELSMDTSASRASNIFSIISFQDIQDNNNSYNLSKNTIQTHHRHLTSLSMRLFSDGGFDHDAFQNIFCGVLLQQDQLRHLSLNFNHLLNQDDWNAFNALTFNNLTLNESPWGLLLPQCLGNPNFNNLKIVEVQCFSDADLVRLGNQCLLMEDLTFFDPVDGTFLSDPSLVPEAFSQVRALLFTCRSLTAESMGDGFSRFQSIEKLTLMFPGQAEVVTAFFQHLPNPLLLKYLEIFNPSSDAISNDFFSAHVSKLSNLESFILHPFHVKKLKITEEELLKLASLKKLKEIKLSFERPEDRRCFTSSSLVRLVEQLPNLNRLESCDCCSFTVESVNKLLAHRSLQDLLIGPVLMLKSKTGNKTQDELFTLAKQEVERLKEHVRKEHPHIIHFESGVSRDEFEDDEQEGNVTTDSRRRQRNEDDE